MVVHSSCDRCYRITQSLIPELFPRPDQLVSLVSPDSAPVAWSVATGVFGCGSIPERNDDTWGQGFFYNELQELNLGPLVLDDATSGVEIYYDIAMTG